MYLSGINYESIVDGVGIRATIFVSGCLHNCDGCQNPKTHNFTYGKPLNNSLLKEIIKNIKSNPLIDGITISGGDAFFSPIDTIDLINTIKKDIPYLNIWIYSGFTYENIIQDNVKYNLLKLCDVLVDGKFDLSLRDITLRYKGSSNQRIINIQKSLKEKKIIEMLTNN